MLEGEVLSHHYTTKLAEYPKNPAYNCIFSPKYEIFYNDKPTAIKPLGLRIQPLLKQANISINLNIFYSTILYIYTHTIYIINRIRTEASAYLVLLF